MTTRARLASGVRTLCGGPPDCPLDSGGLPEHLIYETLLDVESSMLIDAELSDQNRRVSKKVVPLNPNAYDFAVNASDYQAPAFVQLRVNAQDAYQWPVDIVNLASIDRYGQEGKLGAAFYDTPPRVRLSWLPAAGEQLTVWYDRSGEQDGATADESEVSDPYSVHLKLQAAAQCRELMKLPVGDVLAMRIAKGEKQWQRFVRSNRQQGLVDKPSSHPRAGVRYAGRFQRPGGGWL
jgi:hypothetical protein